jgi:CRP-like cAMP-binding protein
MDTAISSGGTNALLHGLSPKVQALLTPQLRRVRLAQGAVLHDVGELITTVYFPITGMVSVLAVMQSGEAIETGVVGSDGYVGGCFGPNGCRSWGHVVMQIAGDAFALNVRHFKQVYDSNEDFREAINAYQAVIYFQAQQTAACQALHSVEQRMCRWLLQAQDALGGDTLHLTQEFLSHLLGVRRTSVSASAHKVQAEGLISYKRGVIRILDRDRLAARACECHAAIRSVSVERTASE